MSAQLNEQQIANALLGAMRLKDGDGLAELAKICTGKFSNAGDVMRLNALLHDNTALEFNDLKSALLSGDSTHLERVLEHAERERVPKIRENRLDDSRALLNEYDIHSLGLSPWEEDALQELLEEGRVDPKALKEMIERGDLDRIQEEIAFLKRAQEQELQAQRGRTRA